MDREDIERLAANPNFVPGIYNYCDRWCERCAFTDKCLNYALDDKRPPDQTTPDTDNEAFWKELSEIFRVTLDMIQEMAREEGIDLDSVDLEVAEKERRSIKKAAEEHPCSRAAKAYSEHVNDWFDSTDDLFEQKTDELNLQAQLELPNSDPVGDASGIKDAVEVIRWYQHFIYVKILRAFRGRLDDLADDSNGSAKVALIAMDRSLAAWGRMYEHFPHQQDEILDVLVRLEQLRRKAWAEFPNAMAFIRPGLD